MAQRSTVNSRGYGEAVSGDDSTDVADVRRRSMVVPGLIAVAMLALAAALAAWGLVSALNNVSDALATITFPVGIAHGRLDAPTLELPDCAGNVRAVRITTVAASGTEGKVLFEAAVTGADVHADSGVFAPGEQTHTIPLAPIDTGDLLVQSSAEIAPGTSVAIHVATNRGEGTGIVRVPQPGDRGVALADAKTVSPAALRTLDCPKTDEQ